MLRSALIAPCVLVACTGAPVPGPAPQPGDVVQRDMLRVAWGKDLETLVSVVSIRATDEHVIQAMSLPLVAFDFDCSVKKLPALAESWEWSADGKVLTMTLRTDVTWSDGVKVTPADVAFTYDLIADPAVASPRSPILDRMDPTGRPKIADDHTIVWHFTEAYDRDTQMSHVVMPILPAHVLKDVDRATLKGAAFNREPVVNGPWRLAEHVANQRFSLEPNPGFSGPADWRPHLKRVEFDVVRDYNARLLKLKKGEVDLVADLEVADADDLRESHRNLTLVTRGLRSMDFVAWNLKKPMFADVRVRRALAMAADIDGLIEKMFRGGDGTVYAQPATGTISPALCGVFNDAITPLPHDVAAAAALLDAAGWKDSDGDGVRDHDGQKLAFTLVTNQETGRRGRIATLLQEQLGAVGAQVNLEQTTHSLVAQRLADRDFDAVLAGWEASLTVDPSDIWMSEGDTGPRGVNYTSYANPKADALIVKGLAEPDPAKAAPTWKELQQVVYDDQPYLFLYWMDEIIAIDNRFDNARIDFLSPFHDLYAWSVPEDKVKYRF